MLTPNELLQILTKDSNRNTGPKRFWVDSQGNKHTKHFNNQTLGGFELTPNRARRYMRGEAIYYKV